MAKPIASPEDVAGSANAPAVEIRVHGVGDHHDWSALGRPSVMPRAGRATETALPPALPDHPLRLVNWSRTSRRRAGWVWYLVTPMTLVNVAGHMTPATGSAVAPAWVHALQRGTVHVTSATLTLATYVWLVVLVETAGRWALLGWSSSPGWGEGVAIGCGVVLGGGMVVRHLVAPEARTSRVVLGAHVALVAVTTVLVAWARPVQVELAGGGLVAAITTVGPRPGSPAPLGPDGQCAAVSLTTYLDPLTVFVLGSVAVVLAAGALLLLAGWTLRHERRLAAPVAMSGLVLVAAVVLHHSVVGSFRMVTDNVLSYLAANDLLPGADYGAESDPRHRVLLPQVLAACGRRDDNALDLYAWLGMTALVAAGLAVLVANLGSRGAGLPPLGRRGAAAGAPGARPGGGTSRDGALLRWARRLVTSLPGTVLRLVLAAGVLWVLLLVAVGWFLFATTGTRPWNVSIVVVHVVGALVTALVLAGRSINPIRMVLGQVADVVGFWPVRMHPLAGSSYRERVVAGIREELDLTDPDATVVLVGHSQGSVLSAWAIAGPGADVERRIVLVTCGSPLRSLYALFFPAHIDHAFFARVQAGTVMWANFWRDTDPIATPIGSADRDIQLADPTFPGGPVLGHNDYWVAPELLAYVEHQIRHPHEAVTSDA